MGAGPAGVSAAITLKQRGYTPWLLEKTEFPRFHIGESLVPEAVRVLRQLGLEDRVAAEGFVHKPGARFICREEGLDVGLTFADGPQAADAPGAWQVERDRFDELLLQGARELGVRVLSPARVTQIEAPTPDGVPVRYTQHGRSHTLMAPVVIDTTGHKSLCARTFGLRRRIPGLETHAFFGHFSGLPRDPGPNGGNVVIAFAPGGWLWGIPLRGGITSVGLVLSAEATQYDRSQPQALLLRLAQQYLPYGDGLQDALRGPVHAYGAINYCATQYALDRIVLAGDAAAFLDPVFSTGVFVGLWGGRQAGQAVADALDHGDLSASAFSAYERQLRVMHHVSLELITMFYQGRFKNLLRAMSGRPALVEEILGLLSGDLLSGRGMMSRALLKRADPNVSLATA